MDSWSGAKASLAALVLPMSGSEESITSSSSVSSPMSCTPVPSLVSTSEVSVPPLASSALRSSSSTCGGDDGASARHVVTHRALHTRRDLHHAMHRDDPNPNAVHDALLYCACGSTTFPLATHVGQSHAPSGTAATGGLQHCWW